MSHLNLSFELTSMTNDQLDRLAHLVKSFSGARPEIKELDPLSPKEEAPAEETKKKPTNSRKKTSTTSEAFADKQREDSAVDEYLANNTEVNDPEIIDTEEDDFMGDSKKEVTLETLRSKITAELLANNRDALKKKIVSFGAEQLKDLKPNTWEAMDKFIDTLK